MRFRRSGSIGALHPFFPRMFCLFNRGLLPFEAFLANAVRRGRIKSLTHKFLDPHPLAIVIDAPTPGTDPHKLFQIIYPFHHTPGGSAHQKPDHQHQQHLDGRPLKQKRERVVREYQCRQFQQVVQKPQHNDAEKAEVLIQNNFRHLRTLFHTTKDDSRKVLPAPHRPDRFVWWQPRTKRASVKRAFFQLKNDLDAGENSGFNSNWDK